MQEINDYIMMLEDKLRDKDIVQYYKRNSEIKVNENLIINNQQKGGTKCPTLTK